MPRIARNQTETTFFHVLVQGINKDFIFNSNEEMEKYEKNIFKYKDKYDLKIIAYCIMNNHAHLLVKAEKIKTLSDFMHKVNMEFATYYNKKTNRVGHVFRNRFKSEEINTKEYLYNCINYIHKNPVKAGICKCEEDYKFSSFKEFKKQKDFFFAMSNSEKIFIDTISEMKKSYDELLETFLLINGLDIDELVKNNCKLKELLIILKEKNNLSYIEIAKRLGISRETLRRKLQL